MTNVDASLSGKGGTPCNDTVIAELEKTMSELLRTTFASRTTLRMDVPEHHCHVDTVCAEALAPGIPTLKLNSSIDQRSTATAQWLEANGQMLIQNDSVNADVKSPQALMSVYGVKAQMLAPLILQDRLIGWISVHYVSGTRVWGAQDITALSHAIENVRTLLQFHGWIP
jgi:maleate isomerase